MYEFKSLIEAIKHLRLLVSSIAPKVTDIVVSEPDGKYHIEIPKPYMGLKEAKDFCKAVMKFGQGNACAPAYIYVLTQWSVMNGNVSIRRNIHGYFRTYDLAVKKRQELVAESSQMHVAESSQIQAWLSETDFEIDSESLQ